MKYRIKYISKSALSIVLAMCMLVSCMTVGIIATDAAKVTGEKVGTNNPTNFGYRGNANSGGYTAFTRINDTQVGYYTATANGWFKVTNGNTWDNDKTFSKNGNLGVGYSNAVTLVDNNTSGNGNINDGMSGTHYICFVDDGSKKVWGTSSNPSTDTKTVYIRNTANATNIRLYVYSPQLYDWENAPYILQNGTVKSGGTNGWTVNELTESGGTKVYKVQGIFNANNIIVRYGDSQSGDMTLTNNASYNTATGDTRNTSYTPPSTDPSIDTFTIDGASSATLNIGETATISSTKSNSSNSVTYEVTEGSDVISLSETTVKALKPGSATITASLTGATSKTVTVTVRTPTLTVTYDPASIYVGGGSTSAPTVTATNVNADTTISSKSFTKSGSAGTINASTGVVTSSASTTGDVVVTATATVTYNGVSYTSATGTATVSVGNRPDVYFKYDQTGGMTTKGLSGTKMTYNNTTGLYEFEVSLSKGNGDGNWYYIVIYDSSDNANLSYNGGLLTESLTTGSGFIVYSGDNNVNNPLHIVASVTGTYKFYFNANDNKLYVECPHTVTFNANGHGTAPAAQVVAYGGKATKPTDPTASGWTFGGWYKESGCTNAWNFSTDTVTTDKTLYAKWTSLPALTAPTIKYDNATTTPVSMDAQQNAKARITWTAISGAGSYEVFKGTTSLGTTTNLYYDIERSYANNGTYTVKAIPSDETANVTSAASNGIQFTFDKVKLNAPEVAQSATDVAKGSTVDFTLTNTNTSYTAGTHYKYQHTGESNNTYADVTNLSWTTDTLNTAGARTFKFKATALLTDYFSDSDVVTKTVTVHVPSYYLVGDLVDSTNNKWNTNLHDYPIDEYVSANVFKRTVTYASGGTNDKHYFRLNNGTNQYTVTSGTDTDMSTHTTSSTAVTASTATTSGSMYVTGQGTYTIYVNQSNKKVWVEKTEAQKYTTIVYVNKDSGATNMYVWKDNNNNVSDWPGEDITTTEETVNDIKYYKYTFESYWDHFDIVVNKGNGNNQSADLTNTAASKTYYVVWDGGDKTPASISETAPVLQLGYKVQNGSSVSHADFANRSVTVSLSANTTYEFWIKSTNSHLNDQNSGTMNRSNCTGWHFPMNETNTKIQADLAGNYTFTYTVTNGEIYVSVTYPPEPKYSVTVNQGDHGTVKVNGNNFTSGNTIQIGSITTASIEAVPASGYHFTGWTTSGGVAAVSGYTTSSNPITISASAQGTITANYEEDSYTLTLASAGNGSITAPSSKKLTVHPITATSLSGVTVTPANGYKFNGWTAGTGVTLTGGSTSSPSTGSVKANQNSTLTAKFTKVSYTLTGKTSLNGTVGNYGTVTFYSNSTCTTQITTAQIGNTVYAKFTSDDYALVSFTKSGTGSSGGTTTGNVYSFTMGYANTTVTAAVRPLTSVTYYVDMHDNDMSGKTVEVAIVTNGGGTTVAKDGSGNDCKANLTKQGNSTVYAASIKTPTTQSGSSYNDIYVRVAYTGKGSYTINIPGTKVATLVSTHEMWLEAENEASAKLTVNYSTRSDSTVASGNRRIYLAKPYGWQTSEPSWENIGIYHWGDYTDIGWNSGIKMHYLGNSGSDGYRYYYVDIPKAIDGNKVNNLIFQGWGSKQSAGTYSKAQTGNIENIPDSANFFILSKDGSAYVGTKSEEDAVIPNYTRYVSSVTMNKTEQTEVFVKPTYTGNRISYTSNNTDVVTVDNSTGKITPVGRGTTTITVQIYGTIGSLVTTEDNDHKDYLTYTVSVTVKDPTQFNGFEVMSLESKTYTVNIPAVSGNQPGYFDMSNVVMTVEGIHGVASSTSSAIITQTATASVSGIGTVCTAFTVKYAMANNLFDNYDDISITGKVVTMSIARQAGQRYGHDHWEADGNTVSFTTTRVINNAVETATTNSIAFDSTKTTYSAIFAAYSYVDVTFTFNYWEYKPKKVDADGNVVADNADGMIQYPYDAVWANNEDSSNSQLFNRSHTQKTFTVQNYEVRGKTASTVEESDLITPAVQALEEMPSNNYYSYMIDADSISINSRSESNFTADATVNMKSQVQLYSVYVNGTQTKDSNNNPLTYTYQQYAEPSVNAASNWYAVDSDPTDQTHGANANTSNAPLLAAGTTSYKFRVKGDTYLRTTTGTALHGDNFIRSEVDFSHYEVTHQGSTPTNMKEYLMQNFYIADFFSSSEVLDPNSNKGQGNLPYDDAQFVGGGVVYYSVTNGTPFANAVSAGYVDGNGTANATAVKEMLKANIEAQFDTDNVAGTVGDEEAMKIAYGTEIAAKKNVEGGFNTGIIYRYLPLNEYKRDGHGNLIADSEGKYTYDVNSNTFRYSNSLQSYQYVYASGNENKATNSGKNMRLYSYYIYSYVAYNQETNVPETRYEVVLSDNYADASTYWEGNPNPNPNS